MPRPKCGSPPPPPPMSPTATSCSSIPAPPPLCRQALGNHNSLTVITNSLTVAEELGGINGNQLSWRAARWTITTAPFRSHRAGIRRRLHPASRDPVGRRACIDEQGLMDFHAGEAAMSRIAYATSQRAARRRRLEVRPLRHDEHRGAKRCRHIGDQPAARPRLCGGVRACRGGWWPRVEAVVSRIPIHTTGNGISTPIEGPALSHCRDLENTRGQAAASIPRRE